MQEENHNLDAAIDALLNVEKQARLGGDVAGTKKAVIDIVELCYKAGAWKTLNDQIVLLSKRRGQLKQVEKSQFFFFFLVFGRGFRVWDVLSVFGFFSKKYTQKKNLKTVQTINICTLDF